MRQYLPFIVVGLTSGSVYALAAMGLVVTYTTSGLFNFAHGAAGMLATFIFYSLRVDAGLPAWLAIPIVVVGVAPMFGVIIDRVILRRLSGAAPATYVVASLGLLVALQGFAIAVYGAQSRQVHAFFPTSTFRVPGVNVGWDQFLVVVIAGAALAVLLVFFRATHLGLQTRAVVDNRDLTELVGADSRGITTVSWMLGTAFAALSGILLSPFVGLDAAILTLLVVYSFGAAIVGRLTSLPLTYLGALLIGVAASLSTKWVARVPQLAGLPSSLPFIVLFLVLVLSPRGWFAEVTKLRHVARTAWRAQSKRIPLPVLAVAIAVLAVLPTFLTGSRVLTATATLVFVLIYASLGLLVGISRQVSLCHAVFAGLGATTLSHLLDHGVPFVVALPLAGLIIVPIGALVAIPAIRLSGLFLALATFGFGVLAQSLVFGTSLGFGGSAVVDLARPSLFGRPLDSDYSYYLFVLVVVALGVALVEVVTRTRLGRLLRALADSPTAVESIGVSPTAARVLVFCLSAFLAAIAGGLLGGLYRSVNTVSFDFFQSLLWLTVLVTAGAASLGGAALAAVLFVTVPAVWTSSKVTEYQPIFFGAFAMLLAQAPNGLAGLATLPNFGVLARASAWRLRSSRVAERHAA